MGIPWDDDPPGSASLIEANIRAVGAQIYAETGLRLPPSVAMAQQWHRDVFGGVPLPVDYYAGEVRDSDRRHPELIGYEVRIGRSDGVASALVPAELAQFEARARNAVGGPDAAIAAGAAPSSPAELRSVLTLAAIVHGEWVRIHPFANGNGRTGRLWALWIAARYGLPPFVRLKPRPAGAGYAAAALSSMNGRHDLMVAVFGQLLNDYLLDPPQS
jgi:fido (protein-threonine AMPylation protein)